MNMDKHKVIEPVLIYTGQSWEAEMLKIMLENAGIDAFINNEVIGTLLPFYTTPGMGAVRLVVSESDAEKAREVVAEFEKDRYK
jgi:UDP-N-acetylglucosamine 2-epimerase